MAEKVTLDTIDEVRSLHRTDFFRLLTGEEFNADFGSTEVPPLDKTVRRDNMDVIMKVVDKFGNRHGQDGYYDHHMQTIREAYIAHDYESFRHEIAELLVIIDCD